MSSQDRPAPSEPAPDDPGDRLERPRPEQGAGQEDASAGDRAREAASTGKEKAREVASTTSRQARKVASTTQDEAHEVVRGVNEQARRVAGDTRQELRSQTNAAGRPAGGGVERCQPATALDGREWRAGCRQRYGPRGGGAHAGDFRASPRGWDRRGPRPAAQRWSQPAWPLPLRRVRRGTRRRSGGTQPGTGAERQGVVRHRAEWWWHPQPFGRDGVRGVAGHRGQPRDTSGTGPRGAPHRAGVQRGTRGLK